MVFQSTSLLAAALLCVTEGARVRVKRPKFAAGVRVRNFRADAKDWLLVFKPDTSDAEIQSFCGEGGCSLKGHPDKRGVPFTAFHANFQDLEGRLAGLADKIDVLEPDETDYMIPPVESDDKGLSSSSSWGIERIGVPGQGNTGRGVHIYVQDTGVRGSHEVFGGRVVPTIDLTSGELTECAGVADCAVDRQGHGTHCAGTAAGVGVGVATEATVHAVKTLSDLGSGARSWQIAAIDWVTTDGASPGVISMSLGGTGADPAYTVAIDAVTLRGMTVVVAAGNARMDSCGFSPAFAEQAITVGATTDINSRAQFSNYGTCNDIMAPGNNIISASISDDTAVTVKSGTSMACPHVAGAVALFLESAPDATRHEVFATMRERAAVGIISGLMDGDPDLFLWVSDEQPPAPTPAPVVAACPEAFSTGPDSDGDCKCMNGTYCYDNGVSGCPYSYTATYNYTSRVYFMPSCAVCTCDARWPLDDLSYQSGDG